MAKYATVRHSTDVKLKSIQVEFVTEDKAIREVRLTDAEGNIAVIKKGDNYGDNLRVLIPAPLEQEKRYHLSGDFLGVTPVSEFFTDEFEAKQRLREYQSKAYHADGCGLSVEPVQVLVNDDGEVVKQAA